MSSLDKNYSIPHPSSTLTPKLLSSDPAPTNSMSRLSSLAEVEGPSTPPCESFMANHAEKKSGQIMVRVMLTPSKNLKEQMSQRIRNQYLQNKKLEEKLEEALEWIKRLDTEKAVPKFTPKAKGAFVVSRRIPTSKSLKKLRGEAVTARLESLRTTVLSQTEAWTIDSFTLNHEFISVLEEYKACVKRFVEDFDAKGVDVIWEKVEKMREGVDKTKLFKKKIHKKSRGIYTKEDAEKVWTELSEYFSPLPSELIEGLKRTGDDQWKFPNLLNMHAVNRLAAIAKMVQYCQDNNIEVEKFKEGRVSQKIRAWHKMHKITAAGNTTSDTPYISPYVDHEGMCYPLLEELNYLLSLDTDTLLEEVTQLKMLLLVPEKNQTLLAEERMLQEITERNKFILGKVSEKMRSEVQDTELIQERKKLQEEYKEIIPAMKRKREKVLKREKKAIKRMEVESKVGEVKSPSGNSETAQEEIVGQGM